MRSNPKTQIVSPRIFSCLQASPLRAESSLIRRAGQPQTNIPDCIDQAEQVAASIRIQVRPTSFAKKELFIQVIVPLPSTAVQLNLRIPSTPVVDRGLAPCYPQGKTSKRTSCRTGCKRNKLSTSHIHPNRPPTTNSADAQKEYDRRCPGSFQTAHRQ